MLWGSEGWIGSMGRSPKNTKQKTECKGPHFITIVVDKVNIGL